MRRWFRDVVVVCTDGTIKCVQMERALKRPDVDSSADVSSTTRTCSGTGTRAGRR
jgi:hypothetical protein